jgi:hypothetical protein
MENEYRNLEINDLLEMWEWCSRRLHVKWTRRRKLRNGCFIGLAAALADESTASPFELVKTYKHLPSPFLDQRKLISFWEIRPMALLELSLGTFTKTSRLTRSLNRIRSSCQDNPTLDELAKKMRAREERYGSEWISEGHHPDREFLLLKKEMEPITEQIQEVIVNKPSIVEPLLLQVLAQGWQFGDVPLSAQVRRTPEKLLNRATRLKLWRVAQQVVSRKLNDEERLGALCDAFYRIVTPSMKAAICAQGYCVDNIVDDMLNFDMHKSRKEITG